MPTDAAEWLSSIVDAVEDMRVAIAIADMRIAGAPLVYVNQAFCMCTGYSKAEAHGRNCRFLQGPETEVASVAVVMDTLRRGADCTVKMTNYRRDGSTFGNLLSLRPVHDTNGVYRFCLSVQCAANAPSAELELYSASIVLLPMRDLVADGTMPVTAERQESNKTLQVEGTEANRFSHQGTGMRSSMSGNRKGLQTVPVEQRARYVRKEMDKALSGKQVSGVEQAVDVRENVRFEHHHKQMLAYLAGTDHLLEKVSLRRTKRSTSSDTVSETHEVPETPAAAEVLEGPAPPVGESDKGEAPKKADTSRADAARAYTKIMWFRSRSAAYVGRLLMLDMVGVAWLESLRRRNVPTGMLSFCIAVARLDTLEAEVRHGELFRIARRYLGMYNTLMEPAQVEARVRQEEKKLLAELVRGEFGEFLMSDSCNVLLNQLRAMSYESLRALGSSRAELHLDLTETSEPHAYAEGTLTPTAELVRVLRSAIKDYPIALMLCDRTQPGLPIACVSQGVHQLTLYDDETLIGFNCRLLQGRRSNKEDVRQLAEAVQEDRGVEVSITNYRRDATCFTNVVTLSSALRIVEGTELVAAVMRRPPDPLVEERSNAETRQLIGVLASCSTREPPLAPKYVPSDRFVLGQYGPGRVPLTAPAPLGFTPLAPALVRSSRERLLDAEKALHNILRLPAVRTLFLKFALEYVDNGRALAAEAAAEAVGGAVASGAASGAGSPEPKGERSNLPLAVEQNVQLNMHSLNVLSERDHYLRSACALWAELDALNRGGRTMGNVAALAKKYIAPEHSGRRASSLWRGLRTVVYDPLDQGEGQDHESHGREHWATASNVSTLLYHVLDGGTEHRGQRGSTDGARDGARGRRMRSNPRKSSEPEPNAAVDAPAGESAAAAEGEAPKKGITFGESVDMPFDFAMLGSAFEVKLTGTEPKPEAPNAMSSRQSTRTMSSQEESDAPEEQNVEGSEGQRMMDENLRDLCMLQHILLRVLAMDVLPAFLTSDAALREVKQELAAQSSRKALHDVLQLELSSIAACMPSTSEEWAAQFSAAAQFLPHPVLLCDMSVPGVPIVSVNSAFEILTGYESAEVVGRSCRFLQGRKTDEKALGAVAEAIRTQSPCHVTLQNYKKDGASFLNLLSLFPIFDSDGLCCYMLGCPVEVAEHYSGTKTQLRHVDRLLKLLSSHLSVPSTPAAKLRMLQIKATVLREKPKRELQSHNDDTRSLYSVGDVESLSSRSPNGRAERSRRERRLSSESTVSNPLERQGPALAHVKAKGTLPDAAGAKGGAPPSTTGSEKAAAITSLQVARALPSSARHSAPGTTPSTAPKSSPANRGIRPSTARPMAPGTAPMLSPPDVAKAALSPVSPRAQKLKTNALAASAVSTVVSPDSRRKSSTSLAVGAGVDAASKLASRMQIAAPVMNSRPPVKAPTAEYFERQLLAAQAAREASLVPQTWQPPQQPPQQYQPAPEAMLQYQPFSEPASYPMPSLMFETPTQFSDPSQFSDPHLALLPSFLFGD